MTLQLLQNKTAKYKNISYCRTRLYGQVYMRRVYITYIYRARGAPHDTHMSHTTTHTTHCAA